MIAPWWTPFKTGSSQNSLERTADPQHPRTKWWIQKEEIATYHIFSVLIRNNHDITAFTQTAPPRFQQEPPLSPHNPSEQK